MSLGHFKLILKYVNVKTSPHDDDWLCSCLTGERVNTEYKTLLNVLQVEQFQALRSDSCASLQSLFIPSERL